MTKGLIVATMVFLATGTAQPREPVAATAASTPACASLHRRLRRLWLQKANLWLG
jgi:hypothetical protein